MLQLQNETPFDGSIFLLPDARGIDTVFTVVKATFTLDDPPRIAETQAGLVMKDVYWDEPGVSSLKYASETHLGKPSTDVALVGHACGPRRATVETLDVGLSVAEKTKNIRVFGDRHWCAGVFGTSISRPVPFQQMPLVYERAFGGVYRTNTEQLIGEERNPVGVGFPNAKSVSSIEGEPLPNLEDPRQLLKRYGDRPSPAAFGFVAPHWQPRRSYVGTYDREWQKRRAPFLPENFDSRFFNCVHPDLTFDRYLQGGEVVRVINASPQGAVEFALPRCNLRVTVSVAGRVETPRPNLETVLIEPDEHRVCLTWRASLACGKQALKVRGVFVEFEGPTLAGTTP